MLTIDDATELYVKHHEPLQAVREEQRRLLADRPGMRAQLDDIEAELTYLLVRRERPARVVEIGCLHGWSTTWLLRALRDNETGVLESYDRIENARRNVPAALAEGRWRFVAGDVREQTLPDAIDYLFLDAAHSARFARWYLDRLLPAIPAGTPVSVHDVFHGRRAKPYSEGSVLLRHLRGAGARYFTAAAKRAPQEYRRLRECRADLGFGDPVHPGMHNPMIWFRRP